MESKSSVSYVYQEGIHFGCTDLQTEALNALLESTKAVVADMRLMEEWWTTVINALGNVEDTAWHRSTVWTGVNDNAVIAALNRIIRAMDLYCETVSLEDHSSDVIQSDHAQISMQGVQKNCMKWLRNCLSSFSFSCSFILPWYSYANHCMLPSRPLYKVFLANIILSDKMVVSVFDSGHF